MSQSEECYKCQQVMKDLNLPPIGSPCMFYPCLERDSIVSRYAHSVKNKHIIHLVPILDKRYLCNHACSVTPSKSTNDISKVTCKNCLRELARLNRLITKVLEE